MSEHMQYAADDYLATYDECPEYYDLLYQRFFSSVPTFISLVTQYVEAGGSVIDVAAGTGEVSIPLLAKGYQVTSLDKSAGMLAVLGQKAQQYGVEPHTVVGDMRFDEISTRYDAVTIRQAINYADSYNELLIILKNFRRWLRDDGVLIFNAPHYWSEAQSYPTVTHHYKDNVGREVYVVETNRLEGRKIRHHQDAIIWHDNDQPLHLRDKNEFSLYTVDEFRSALRAAGFGKVMFFGTRLEPLSRTHKTMYGVAMR